MKRPVKRKTSKKSQVRNGGLVLIGTGLLLLGLVTGIMLLSGDKDGITAGAAQGNSSVGSSVIPVAVNFEAPDLRLKDLQGNDVAIQDHRGKVILVNNWATWCPPCKAEMPALQAFYQAHQDEGFVLIAIDAGDQSADVADFVRNFGLSFHVWLDPESQALDAFKNYGLPSSYVIDQDGVVRLAWTGAISDAMLEKYVTPLLQE